MKVSKEEEWLLFSFVCVCVHKKHNLKCSDDFSLTCDDVTNDDQQSFEV